MMNSFPLTATDTRIAAREDEHAAFLAAAPVSQSDADDFANMLAAALATES